MQRIHITWCNEIIKPGKQPLFRIAMGTATENMAYIQPISIFTVQLHGQLAEESITDSCKALFDLEGPADEGRWVSCMTEAQYNQAVI
eukprot:9971030-Heterocapsa_arctica.AAC.1